MWGKGNWCNGWWLALCCLAGAAASTAIAQPVQLPLFRAGTVSDALITADGGVLTVGAYSYIDATPVGTLVRLRPDASVDPAWLHAIDGPAYRLLQDPTNGTILVFGYFSTIGGEVRRHIARFGADGTLLPWQVGFANPADTPTIERAAVLADGDIVASAFFQSVQSVRLIRIDGDSGVATPLWDFSGGIAEILALPDGSVVLAGSLSAIGGVPVSGAARLSGPELTPSDFLQAPPLPIVSMDRDAADGRFYVASGNSVYRFDAAGMVDATWRVDSDGPIDHVKVDGTRGVLVSGAFTRVAGTVRSRVARLSKQASTVDVSWVPPLMRGRSGTIAANADHVFAGGDLVSVQAGQVGLVVLSAATGLPVAPAQRRRFGSPGDYIQTRGHRAVGLGDGGVIVTGSFSHTTDQVLPGIVRLDADGSPMRDWAPQIGGRPTELALGDDGFLYISGFLAFGGELATNSVIRVNIATGAVDPTWRMPATGTADYTFALDSNFAYTFNVTSSPSGGRGLSRWSLTSPAVADPDWRAPASAFDNFRALLPPRADGSLVYATWYGCCVDFNPPPPPGTGRKLLRMALPGAAEAVAFGPTLDRVSEVARIRTDALGRLYLSGRMRLDGQSEMLFPRLLDNGSLDTSFQFQSATQWASGAMALSPDGAWLYAGITEQTAQGWFQGQVVRFDTNTGAIDQDWAPHAIAGWFPADIVAAGNRIFVVADWWSTSEGVPMMTAAFVDPEATPLLRDGFESSAGSP